MIYYKEIYGEIFYLASIVSEDVRHTHDVNKACNITEPTMMYYLLEMGYNAFVKEDIDNCDYKQYRKEL